MHHRDLVSPMRRCKPEWLLIIGGSMLGTFIGLAVASHAFWGNGEHPMAFLEPFHYGMGWSSAGSIPPPPGFAGEVESTAADEQAHLDVEVFGTWRYSRKAPNHHDLDDEYELLGWLNLTPGVLFIGLCFAFGTHAGAMSGRWARRRRVA